MSGNYGDTRDLGFLQPEVAAPDDDATLDAVLQQWIVGITALPGTLVRPRYQSAQPPMPSQDTNWAAIGVLSQESDANDWMGHDPAGDGGLGTSQMQRHEDLEIMVTFYGAKASGYAGIVRDNARIGQNDDLFGPHGIVFAGSGTIRLLPELVGQLWVRRADLPLMFRRQVTRVYPVRTLVSAPVQIVNDPT